MSEAAIEAIGRAAADGRLAEAALISIDEIVKPTAEERAVRRVSSRLDDTRVVEIQDVGHLGHVTAPQAVAEELVRFFREPPNES